MSFALIGLKLLGFGRGIITWLSHRSVAELALIALALFAVVQRFELSHARSNAARWHKQFDAEHKARADDRRAYERAQAEAKAKNEAKVKSVEAEQQRISDNVKSDLNSQLERLRRELRDNPSAKGSAGRAPIPESGPAPCRAASAAWLCLSPDDRLRAAENEERHDQLINWVERQSQVDPNISVP